MNKTEFLTQLELRLASISEDDRDAALLYYGEIIDEYMEGGYTEESAVSRLSHIDSITKEILADPSLPGRKRNIHNQRESMHAKPVRIPLRKLVAWEIFLLILTFPIWGTLLLAACILALSFFLLCILLVVAVYAIDFLLAAIAIAACLCAPIPALLQTSLPAILLLLGIAFICAGLSILMFRGANRLTIYLLRLCKYLFYRGIAKFRERRVVA